MAELVLLDTREYEMLQLFCRVDVRMRITWVIPVLLIGGLAILWGTNVPVLTQPAPVAPLLPPVAASPVLSMDATPASRPATSLPRPATEPIPVPGPNEVWLHGGEYRPGNITVPVGTTVTWIGYDNDTQHDVASETGLFFCSLALGDSFSYTFTERGTFNYSCDCNPGMAGTVIVE